jgi:DNA-binding NarL/FixJ family response regulator
MEAAAAAAAPRPVTCLVVEDNRAMLDAVAALLGKAGFNVLGAVGTGLEALHLLEEVQADILVLDVRLPDLHGVDVARLAADVAPETAVIFHTTHADAKLVEDCLGAGARGLVLKDVTPARLATAVSAVAGGEIYVDPRLRGHPPIGGARVTPPTPCDG